MPNKKCFTNDQVHQLDQLLKLTERCSETIHAAVQYIEYGPQDRDPHIKASIRRAYEMDDTLDIKDIPPSKREQLSKRVGHVLSSIEHLQRAGILDARVMYEQKEKKFWQDHDKWGTKNDDDS